MKEKRLEWIDVLKFCAILAVFFDHNNGKIYTNSIIEYSTYFSVTLFVAVSGINAYTSNLRHMSDPYYKDLFRKLKAILLPYSICVIPYTFAQNGYCFDVVVYWKTLIQFNATAPLYFVVFYIQLLLVSRPMAKVLVITNASEHRRLLLFGEGFILLMASVFFMKYTFVLPVWGEDRICLVEHFYLYILWECGLEVD